LYKYFEFNEVASPAITKEFAKKQKSKKQNLKIEKNISPLSHFAVLKGMGQRQLASSPMSNRSGQLLKFKAPACEINCCNVAPLSDMEAAAQIEQK
jgi:hypothetical protein